MKPGEITVSTRMVEHTEVWWDKRDAVAYRKAQERVASLKYDGWIELGRHWDGVHHYVELCKY